VAELNPEYLQKMEDVLATYEKPYTATEPVVCLDEKPVTLHADIRPPIPAAPGRMAKRDNEYKRCGTANVFCAVEPKAGRHFTLPTPNRSGPEFAQALETVVRSYPGACKIHLVMDNVLIQFVDSFARIQLNPFAVIVPLALNQLRCNDPQARWRFRRYTNHLQRSRYKPRRATLPPASPDDVEHGGRIQK